MVRAFVPYIYLNYITKKIVWLQNFPVPYLYWYGYIFILNMKLDHNNKSEKKLLNAGLILDILFKEIISHNTMV